MREYDHASLRRLLKTHFEEIDILGLTATDEIREIERRLLKQSPIEVYFISPLNGIVKRLGGSKNRKQKEKWYPDNSLIDRISINDYVITKGFLEACLDLYAICIKK